MQGRQAAVNGSKQETAMSTRRWLMPWVGLIALAASLRLIGLNKGIWLDEYAAIDIITRNALLAARDYDYPPSYFLLLKGWSVFGMDEPHLRLLSVILGYEKASP